MLRVGPGRGRIAPGCGGAAAAGARVGRRAALFATGRLELGNGLELPVLVGRRGLARCDRVALERARRRPRDARANSQRRGRGPFAVSLPLLCEF